MRIVEQLPADLQDIDPVLASYLWPDDDNPKALWLNATKKETDPWQSS